MAKSKLTSPWGLFFSCLILGVFGVHRFLERKYLSGCIYLLTLGLFGFGWIFDCCRLFIPALKSGSPFARRPAASRRSGSSRRSTGRRSTGQRSRKASSGRKRKKLSPRIPIICASAVAAIVLLVVLFAVDPLGQLSADQTLQEADSQQAASQQTDPDTDLTANADAASADYANASNTADDADAAGPTDAANTANANQSGQDASTGTSLPAGSTFNIRFIDVGQADAALVECDGHYMLIDGGNKADSDIIYTVLKNEGVPKLDIVVGTHAHEDHIGGLPGAFSYTTADLTLCPVTSGNSKAFQNFADYAAQYGGGITVPSAGETYALGSATVEILGLNATDDTNNTSIVLMIQYGDTRFLFTGDAERDAEQALLNAGVDLSADVLKVGHHGSETSTTYPFLREVMPTYAVISVGEGNSYGHPTEEVLSRLRDADVTVYRTDLQGDILCSSNGTTVTFSTSR